MNDRLTLFRRCRKEGFPDVCLHAVPPLQDDRLMPDSWCEEHGCLPWPESWGLLSKVTLKSVRLASSVFPAHPHASCLSPSLSPHLKICLHFLGPWRESMSSLFSSEKPDLVSFSPRLSVRARRWMTFHRLQRCPEEPQTCVRGVCALGWEGAGGACGSRGL